LGKLTELNLFDTFLILRNYSLLSFNLQYPSCIKYTRFCFYKILTNLHSVIKNRHNQSSLIKNRSTLFLIFINLHKGQPYIYCTYTSWLGCSRCCFSSSERVFEFVHEFKVEAMLMIPIPSRRWRWGGVRGHGATWGFRTPGSDWTLRKAVVS